MTPTKTTATGERYIEAVGRRKTAIARVRITPATKTTYSVNGKDLPEYFTIKEQAITAAEALATSKIAAKFKISVVLKGGGMNAQADAMRHGMARAIIEYDKELRGVLKKAGLLKRDPRAKERRKFGLRKARKAPQWSKR
ncbi:MAG: rpsI [Candidatus Taylorbacteria bacterium]|nr:rpsI [Candidatus Taylorbacteria bacterium]